MMFSNNFVLCHIYVPIQGLFKGYLTEGWLQEDANTDPWPVENSVCIYKYIVTEQIYGPSKQARAPFVLEPKRKGD